MTKRRVSALGSKLRGWSSASASTKARSVWLMSRLGALGQLELATNHAQGDRPENLTEACECRTDRRLAEFPPIPPCG